MEFKASNFSQLGYFSSTFLLREVMSPLRNSKCRVLVEKLPGLKCSVRLWEASVYGRCPLAEVRLYRIIQATVPPVWWQNILRLYPLLDTNMLQFLNDSYVEEATLNWL